MQERSIWRRCDLSLLRVISRNVVMYSRRHPWLVGTLLGLL
jgi:hypothetical protein